jgi:hypothetical protein
MDQNRKVTWVVDLLYKFQVQITTHIYQNGS